MEVTTEDRLKFVLRDTLSGKLVWHRGARLAHAEGKYFGYVYEFSTGTLTEFKKIVVVVDDHGEQKRKQVYQSSWEGLNEDLQKALTQILE